LQDQQSSNSSRSSSSSSSQQRKEEKLSATRMQFPPCSRYAPACYQEPASWQTFRSPLPYPAPLPSDRRSFIGAPPGLEEFGPESLPLNAPSAPITPPPLPVPCFVTPSRALVEAFGSGKCEQFPPKFNMPTKFDLDRRLASADTDVPPMFDLESRLRSADAESVDSGELFPYRLSDSSSEEATSAARMQPEDIPSWFSKGSLKHDAGKCTRCHFFTRKHGCTNGSKCRYCHLHEDLNRPDKRKRDKAKRAVDEWEQKSCDSQTKGELGAIMASKDSYTKMLVEKRLKDMDNEAHTSFQLATGFDGSAQCRQGASRWFSM